MGSGPLAGDGGAGRVLIPRRFNGPPASANGGYTCGLIARYVGGPAAVSLRSPPPLDTALALTRGPDREVVLRHRDVVVAEGAPAGPLDLEPPVRPTVAQAREALRRHPWLTGRHPFSDCYVCGAGRHDGLGLHFGDLRGHDGVTAALLVADETVPHDADGVAPEIAWGALDCPSYVPALWDADVLSLLALDARRGAGADPARRADRRHRLAAERRGAQDLHRVGAAERRRAAAGPRSLPVGAAAR